MATVNLGSIKFNWQGAYDNATAYAVDDVVSSGGNSYICIAATTGNTPPNATYWELMAQAGTNGTDGTDLTTTLTTQGDIVYRDASGLARLGAGTSGQVLQTGGAGANPSWGTVSSDFVLLNRQTNISGASTITIDNLYSSTYLNYKIVFNGLNMSASAEPYIRFLNSSGSEISSANYINSAGTSGMEWSGGSSSYASAYNNNNKGHIMFQDTIGVNNTHNSTLVLEVQDPLNTGVYPIVGYTYYGASESVNNWFETSRGAGQYRVNQSTRGIRLTSASSTFSCNKVSVYGYK